MKEELSYILTTPYTLAKSRTGGVLSRLLSRLDLELIAAQIFAPDKKTVEAYAKAVRKHENPEQPEAVELLYNYIIENMSPTDGKPHRVALFLFRGENACKKLRNVVGALYPENRSLESMKGETIRDTYADMVFSRTDPEELLYFEPAVLTPPDEETALENLQIFADFTKDSNNVVDNMAYIDPSNIEKTLVIIKPDNWRYPSSRPGTIIDMFSRTGLRIVGCKIYQMSVNEALEFYGPVKEALEKKLGPKMGNKAVDILNKEFNISVNDDASERITELFGEIYAHNQFDQIVEFMSGRRPHNCPLEERDYPGKVKTMVVVYEGENAISKIREVLGPTDPTKAPGGTIRREFGHDVMVNTAHASDSKESVERESKVISIQDNNLSNLINQWINDN